MLESGQVKNTLEKPARLLSEGLVSSGCRRLSVQGWGARGRRWPLQGIRVCGCVSVCLWTRGQEGVKNVQYDPGARWAPC